MKKETVDKGNEIVRRINRLEEDIKYFENIKSKSNIYLDHVVCNSVKHEFLFSPEEVEHMIAFKQQMLETAEKELEELKE